jgi:cytochrome c biogenesis protein CcdA/thioredoxin-related protein
VQARAARALLLALALAALASAQPVRWLSYEDALARAAAEGKPVYMYFYSKSCPYCEMMEEKTFPNASVSEMLNTRFIPARVDVEQRPDLASTYWVPGTPFHVFLCPNGSLLGVASGYRDPDSFLKLLNTALAKTEEKCANQTATSAGRVSEASEQGFEGAFGVAAAFALGLFTPLTPCILPLLPAVYLAASRGGKRGLALFALGLFAAYAVLGAVAGGLLLAARSYFEPLAYVLLLFSGLALAIERVGRLLSYLASALASRIPQRRTTNAFLLGLAASVLWGPCAAPIAGAAVALSVATPHLALASSTAFAGGASLAVYAFAGAVKRVRALAGRARALKLANKAIGVLMVAASLLHFAGFY